MLSEKIRNLLSTWMAGYARGLIDECADEAAKLERVARAARDASTGPYLLVHESCLFFDGTNDSCQACRLIAALADLPEDALGG